MSATEAASLFTSSNRLALGEELVPASHWKQVKRNLYIDFKYLDKLLSPTISKYEDEDSTLLEDSLYEEDFGVANEKFNDLRLSNVLSQNKTARLMLHSSNLSSVFYGTGFRDLASTGQDLEQIFSQEWWLNFQNPPEAELRHVCAAFNIHPLTIEDIWNQETLEKIEQYPSYRFVCFRSFNEVLEDDEINYKPFTVFLIIFSQGTLCFCFEENDHSQNIERRIMPQGDEQAIKSEWIFYSFVDEIVDSFQPPITRIEKAVSQIEDSVYTTRQEDAKTYLAQIEANRKQVLSLIRLLSSKDKVLRGFKAHHLATTNSNPNVILYINDVQDHVVTMLGNLNQFEGLLFRAKSNFISQLQGTHYIRRSKIYKLMCSATVLNFLFTVGMIIAQTFGMNVSTKAGLFNKGSVAPWSGIVGTYCLFVLVLYKITMRYVWTW